ncbi:hypothetical protein N0V90_010438 [Kalmusia sp. IMI 367209]|nr:hypothetical protein N0V90_010438 [Kalmusia sp. IMI 367209]
MRIRPFIRADHPQVAEITFQAFQKDEFFDWLSPGRHKYPEDLRRSQRVRLRYRLVDVGQYGFVVVTEEGDPDWSGKEEIMGFAFLLRIGQDGKTVGWQADSLFNKIERQLIRWEQWYDATFMDRAADPKHMKELLDLAPWTFFKPINPRWHLGLIGVSPKFQRRGVGSMLVQQGQKFAAQEGVPMTLEASVVGRRLYLKNGFKKVHEMAICDGYVDHLMVWEPAGSEGTWLEDIEGGTARMKGAN